MDSRGQGTLGAVSAEELCSLGSITGGSFSLWMGAAVSLIKDGKIGAGKVRAAKIAQVIGYQTAAYMEIH